MSGDLSKQVLLEEYRSLRAQIDYQIKEARDLERNVLVATGFVYAWLASIQAPSLLALPAWIFPFILALIGRERATRINRRIDTISIYISEIEDLVHGQALETFGWETRILKNRKGGGSQLGKSQTTYWKSLIIGTLVAMVYGAGIQILKTDLNLPIIARP